MNSRTRSILEVFQETSYLPKSRDQIFSKLFDLFQSGISCNLFLYKNEYSKLNYFVLTKEIQGDKKNKLEIIIHLLPNYPETVPSAFVFFQSIKDLEKFAANQNSNIIANSTLELKPNTLIFYDSAVRLDQIIVEFDLQVKTTFPLVLKNSKSMISTANPAFCVFQSTRMEKVVFADNEIILKEPNISPNKVNGPKQNPPLDDSSLKIIIIHEIACVMEKQLQSTIDQYVKEKEDALKLISVMNEQISINMAGLNKITLYFNALQEKIDYIRNYLQSNNVDQSHNDTLDMTKLSNYQFSNNETSLLHAVAVESTIEELIPVVRKAFERNIISFDCSIKLIRNLSREIVKIRFCKDKMSRIQ